MFEIAKVNEVFVDFNTQLAVVKKENENTVFDYRSKEGNKAARSLIRKLGSSKTAVTKAHKEAKAEALAFGKALDAEKKRLIESIDEMIMVHKEPIKQIEEEIAEKERVIQAKLNYFTVTIDAVNSGFYGSEELQEIIENVNEVLVDDSFGEHIEKAELLKFRTLDFLKKEILKAEDLEEKNAKEAQEKKEKEERLEKERIEAEKAKLLKLKAEKAEAEQLAIEAEKRCLREKAIAEEKAKKDAAIAEEKRLKDLAIAKEKAAKELAIAKEKAAKEKAEAEERIAAIEEERRIQKLEEKERHLEELRLNEIQAVKEAEEKLKLEQEKAAADLENVKAKNHETLDDLVTFGVPEDMAKMIIGKIVKGKIKNLIMEY